jgi:hypothetical protein
MKRTQNNMNKEAILIITCILSSIQIFFVFWYSYRSKKSDKELIARWEETYLKYMEAVDELRKYTTNGSAHLLAKFDAKAMTIRDCIKDLKNKTI